MISATLVRVSDTRLSDTRLSDTRLSDTRLSDPRLSDTRLSDPRLSDAGISDADVAHALACRSGTRAAARLPRRRHECRRCKLKRAPQWLSRRLSQRSST